MTFKHLSKAEGGFLLSWAPRLFLSKKISVAEKPSKAMMMTRLELITNVFFFSSSWYDTPKKMAVALETAPPQMMGGPPKDSLEMIYREEIDSK